LELEQARKMIMDVEMDARIMMIVMTMMKMRIMIIRNAIHISIKRPPKPQKKELV